MNDAIYFSDIRPFLCIAILLLAGAQITVADNNSNERPYYDQIQIKIVNESNSSIEIQINTLSLNPFEIQSGSEYISNIIPIVDIAPFIWIRKDSREWIYRFYDVDHWFNVTHREKLTIRDDIQFFDDWNGSQLIQPINKDSNEIDVRTPKMWRLVALEKQDIKVKIINTAREKRYAYLYSVKGVVDIELEYNHSFEYTIDKTLMELMPIKVNILAFGDCMFNWRSFKSSRCVQLILQENGFSVSNINTD